MNGDLIMPGTRCAVVLVLLTAVPLGAQDQPDFSAHWILESTSRGAPDVPLALWIRQPLLTANILGEPVKPLFADLTVVREFENGTRSESYKLGVVGGSVPGVHADGSTRPDPYTHHRVAWEGRALVIEIGSSTGPTPRSGEWAERREVWSLESNDRLHVAVTTSSSVEPARTVKSIYRKQ